MDLKRTLVAPTIFIATLAAAEAQAGQKEELLEIKNTVVNLMDALVEEGILSKEKAQKLIKKAEEKAATDAAAQAEAEPKADAELPADGKVVRVPYVPEFVKQEIREQVKRELRNDVAKDVMAQAKTEKWGVPAALPDWLTRITWMGDIRLREQYDILADNNSPGFPNYPNFLRVNAAGGLLRADPTNDFFNTTENRDRQQIRLRLGMEAKITDSIKAGLRLTTGSTINPVSDGQVLGQTNNRYTFDLDQAFLQYDGKTEQGYSWLTLAGGRIANPWTYTQNYTPLLWDEDITFEGVAATFRYNFVGSDSLLDKQDRSDMLVFTAGAFPVQEVDISDRDKWMFGGKLGYKKTFSNQTTAVLSAAYYDFQGITGVLNCSTADLNCVDPRRFDFTAPQFMQKGNTLFDIRNDFDITTNLFALASDYNVLNLTAELDLANFSPIHIILTGDYAKNLGFNREDILRRTGSLVDERTTAYDVQLTVGWPRISKWADWDVFANYRYIERDAVLDAFADNNFHLGGTDAKGWIIGGHLGIAKNTWLRARWFSTDSIDGPPFSVDTLQVDLNAKF